VPKGRPRRTALASDTRRSQGYIWRSLQILVHKVTLGRYPRHHERVHLTQFTSRILKGWGGGYRYPRRPRGAGGPARIPAGPRDRQPPAAPAGRSKATPQPGAGTAARCSQHRPRPAGAVGAGAHAEGLAAGARAQAAGSGRYRPTRTHPPSGSVRQHQQTDARRPRPARRRLDAHPLQ
jgi:hypothetical protein